MAALGSNLQSYNVSMLMFVGMVVNLLGDTVGQLHAAPDAFNATPLVFARAAVASVDAYAASKGGVYALFGATLMRLGERCV
eukprot:1007417-Pyramimonas_sp.AAC.1